MKPRPAMPRRLRNSAMLLAVSAGLIGVNGPVVLNTAQAAQEKYETSRPEYKAAYGQWRTVEFPKEFRVNALHAVLLRTGKVLIVAGSGNDRKQFDKGSFRSVLWDPVTDEKKNIPTPADLFCAGHVTLPNGNVLIAGGTRRYETLEADVKRVAGVVTIKNESPDGAAVPLAKGTVLTSPDGRQYRSTEDVSLAPAAKMLHGNKAMVTASSTTVWVEAVTDDKAQVIARPTQLSVAGQTGGAVYGQADDLSLKKQEYQGLDASYEFDPIKETYQKTGQLTNSRWYPTLIGVKGGNVLAVSGLDQHGVVLPGNNEVYELSKKQWFDQPRLNRYFPTYPSLFRLKDDRLFYSGSNAGYGSDTEGRQPGIWDLTDNSFQKVPGLRESRMNETSSSVLLAPAQDQRVLIAGGGETGDKPQSTSRVDIVDLSKDKPAYRPGPALNAPTRYLATVTLPNDQVLLTGGSSGYRGAGQSDHHTANLLNPAATRLDKAAAPRVGRNYHSSALLLPDGRVVTLGSDPLYADKDNKLPGSFEQRVEIYEPPYLFKGARPTITDAPLEITRGTTFKIRTGDADVSQARLLRPSAVTHVTDTEQRSVRLDITPEKCALKECGVRLSLDKAEGLTPSGYYMMVVLNKAGTPSVARWVHVK